jgi:hypothetical protein
LFEIMRYLLLSVILLILRSSLAGAQPLCDHHQHLFSPAVLEMFSPGSPGAPAAAITATDLIRHLDDAGIKCVTVLSTAYILASPSSTKENEPCRSVVAGSACGRA